MFIKANDTIINLDRVKIFEFKMRREHVYNYHDRSELLSGGCCSYYNYGFKTKVFADILYDGKVLFSYQIGYVKCISEYYRLYEYDTYYGRRADEYTLKIKKCHYTLLENRGYSISLVDVTDEDSLDRIEDIFPVLNRRYEKFKRKLAKFFKVAKDFDSIEDYCRLDEDIVFMEMEEEK